MTDTAERNVPAAGDGSDAAHLPPATGHPPAPGWYPVPGRRGAVLERRWDGDVWCDEARPPERSTTSLPHYRRDPVRFLQRPGWILFLVFVVGSVASGLLAHVHPHATRVHGIQWLAVPSAAASTVAVLLGFLWFVHRRVRFDQVVHRWWPVVAWGVASGVIGFGIAIGLERNFSGLFHRAAEAHQMQLWSTGPAEELSKVLVPVVLWFTGRFRNPRQGLVLVLISGITFGVLEGVEYSLTPDAYQWTRALGELIHPLLAGMTAAVAWRCAWKRSSWFTVPGLLALGAAMLLHSLNDVLRSDRSHVEIFSLTTPAVLLVAYIAFKPAARRLVPPDNVSHVSPMWRPHAGRHVPAPSGQL